MSPETGERDQDQNVDSGPTPRGGRLRRRIQENPRLSLGARIVLFIVGWALVLIGIAGLALPGIQGILTILLGTAVLSAASETAYRLLRWTFGRWPRLWQRIDGLRDKVRSKLGKKPSPPREPGS